MLQNIRQGKRSSVRRANVTACTRCRLRKQRCDQGIPACSSCQQAGVECVSMDLDGKAAPRSYIKQLEDKVASLEAQLQKTDNGIPQVGTNMRELPDDFLSHYPTLPSPNTDWLVQMGTMLEPSDEAADALLGEPLPASRMPASDAARSLITVYFEHSDSFTPVLRRHKLEAILRQSSADDGERGWPSDPRCFFTLSIVFATATLLMNRKTPSFPAARADAYFVAARNIISQNPGLLCVNTPQAVENSALLIQFLLLAAKLRPAWHLIGTATRLIVELNLHKQEAHDLSTEAGIDRCWLFWSIYSFERILCAVIERPVTIPDETITAPLPPCHDEPSRLEALQLIQQRQILSEISATLMYGPAKNGAALDLSCWRAGMLQRLQATHAPTYYSGGNSTVTDPEVLIGYNSQLVILLLFPPFSQPVTDAEGIALLASTSYTVIHRYRHLFKVGPLRYYWRTMHHLYRAGSAMIYCLKQLVSTERDKLLLTKYTESVNICSAVLWGMTERYQPGAKYRDDFDVLASSLSDLDLGPEVTTGQTAAVDFESFLDVGNIGVYTDLDSQ